jgi:hypothetical protein
VQRDGEGLEQPEIGSSGSSIQGVERRRKRLELRCEYDSLRGGSAPSQAS